MENYFIESPDGVIPPIDFGITAKRKDKHGFADLRDILICGEKVAEMRSFFDNDPAYNRERYQIYGKNDSFNNYSVLLRVGIHDEVEGNCVRSALETFMLCKSVEKLGGEINTEIGNDEKKKLLSGFANSIGYTLDKTNSVEKEDNIIFVATSYAINEMYPGDRFASSRLYVVRGVVMTKRRQKGELFIGVRPLGAHSGHIRFSEHELNRVGVFAKKGN